MFSVTDHEKFAQVDESISPNLQKLSSRPAPGTSSNPMTSLKDLPIIPHANTCRKASVIDTPLIPIVTNHVKPVCKASVLDMPLPVMETHAPPTQKRTTDEHLPKLAKPEKHAHRTSILEEQPLIEIKNRKQTPPEKRTPDDSPMPKVITPEKRIHKASILDEQPLLEMQVPAQTAREKSTPAGTPLPKKATPDIPAARDQLSNDIAAILDEQALPEVPNQTHGKITSELLPKLASPEKHMHRKSVHGEQSLAGIPIQNAELIPCNQLSEDIAAVLDEQPLTKAQDPTEKSKKVTTNKQLPKVATPKKHIHRTSIIDEQPLVEMRVPTQTPTEKLTSDDTSLPKASTPEKHIHKTSIVDEQPLIEIKVPTKTPEKLTSDDTPLPEVTTPNTQTSCDEYSDEIAAVLDGQLEVPSETPENLSPRSDSPIPKVPTPEKRIHRSSILDEQPLVELQINTLTHDKGTTDDTLLLELAAPENHVNRTPVLDTLSLTAIQDPNSPLHSIGQLSDDLGSLLGESPCTET